MEGIIQFILGLSGLWLIIKALRREEEMKHSVLFVIFGALVLLDAVTLQNQLSWWTASTGSPYDVAIGLAIPGVIGSVLLGLHAILSHPEYRRQERIAIGAVAVFLILLSLCNTWMAWPTQVPQNQRFY